MFKVKVIDVDGSSSRRYKSLAGAVKRFEEMSGIKVSDAIADQYGADYDPLPDLERLRYNLSAVGRFGNRVILSKVAEA